MLDADNNNNNKALYLPECAKLWQLNFGKAESHGTPYIHISFQMKYEELNKLIKAIASLLFLPILSHIENRLSSLLFNFYVDYSISYRSGI